MKRAAACFTGSVKVSVYFPISVSIDFDIFIDFLVLCYIIIYIDTSVTYSFFNKKGSIRMSSDIKFLTVEDVGEMLQVTRGTVYNLKKKGMPFIKVGKNIRFDKNEVVDWIKANRNEDPDPETR